MWKNAPFLAIVAVDTAENEPSKKASSMSAAKAMNDWQVADEPHRRRARERVLLPPGEAARPSF